MSEIQKAFGCIAKKVFQRIEQLKSAPTLLDMVNYPAARCHKLKGDRRAQWALDISGNYRMMFKINQEPLPLKRDGTIDTLKVVNIMIIETTDYH